MTTRFYIGKQGLDEIGSNLEEWLAGKIPSPPIGTLCEDDQHDTWIDEVDAPPVEATTYIYRIEDGHVCYTYVCDECDERADPEYLVDVEYPITQDGYAVAPKHCT